MRVDRKTQRNVIIGIWLIFCLSYIIYCNYVMIELPYLTWLDQLPLADQWLSGDMRASDLFSKYGEHGLLGNNILWLINVSFFHGTTKFDVYINDIYVCVSAALFVYLTDKYIVRFRYRVLAIVGELVFLCSFMQNSSGAMETQVRAGLAFYILSYIFIEKDLMMPEECSIRKLVADVILIILTINVFGTLYSFAGIPFIWFMCLFYRFYKKESGTKVKVRLIISLTYLATIPIYVIEYRLLSRISHDKDGVSVFSNLIDCILHPIRTMQCVFSWNANGLLGWAYHERTGYSSTQWLIIGAAVTMITLLCITYFFKNEYHENTWLPMVSIVYSIGVCALVVLGRSAEFEWLSNQWYNTHIRFQMAAVMYMLVVMLVNSRARIIKVIAMVSYTFMICFACISMLCELQRAPYVKEYYKEIQKWLFVHEKEELVTDENGNTPLLHTLDMSWRGINILKKWDLSVYEYYSVYQQYLGDQKELLDLVYEYEPGTILYFDSNRQNYIKYVQGMSQVEEDYTWTDGNQVVIKASVDKNNIVYDDRTLIMLNLASVYGDSQELEVSINNNESQILCANGGGEYTICINNDLQEGENTITISLPNADSPSNHGGNDKRTLGLAIKTICISE